MQEGRPLAFKSSQLKGKTSSNPYMKKIKFGHTTCNSEMVPLLYRKELQSKTRS
jgi:hypothetical protein